jgi:glycine betaine/proline transport system ATP-binding protein
MYLVYIQLFCRRYVIAGTKFPLAVIEEETGKLLGLISQTSLIIEATRFEEKK